MGNIKWGRIGLALVLSVVIALGYGGQCSEEDKSVASGSSSATLSDRISSIKATENPIADINPQVRLSDAKDAMSQGPTPEININEIKAGMINDRVMGGNNPPVVISEGVDIE